MNGWERGEGGCVWGDGFKVYKGWEGKKVEVCSAHVRPL